MRTHPQRYAPSPWSEVAPSDLEPMGEPDVTLEYRHELHLGLNVPGVFVSSLGMLAVRCECRGERVIPLGLAIADGTIVVAIPPGQSNPRRHKDPGGD